MPLLGYGMEDVASRVITGITISIQANAGFGISLRHGVLEKKLPVWSNEEARQ
jgi:hypothetical protein